jgi:hypothetical protein
VAVPVHPMSAAAVMMERKVRMEIDCLPDEEPNRRNHDHNSTQRGKSELPSS